MPNFLLSLVILVLLAGCAGRPLPSTYPTTFRTDKLPVIRIGLLVNQSAISVTGTGGFKVVDRSSGEVIGSSSRGRVWNLRASGAWITVDDPAGDTQGLYSGPIHINPDDQGGRIWLSGREYRGSIEVLSNTSSALTAVNIIDMENYLRGVVPLEIGRLDARRIEALKTQAIAARTYAIANMGRRKSLGFDLYGTVSDQVYRGYSAEWHLADRAILETRGVVITYNKEPIDAYYSSTCGGETEAIEEAWRSDPVPYLRNVEDLTGRRNEHFCKASPVYRWRVEWNRSTLERILASSLPGMDPRKSGEVALYDMAVRQRSRSGRVHLLEIKTNHGAATIRGDQIRSVLRRPVQGTPMLRSTLFRLEIERDRSQRPRTIVAEGGGYGHGIGLCQTGAIGMADQGFDYEQILRHYYRGIDLHRAY